MNISKLIAKSVLAFFIFSFVPVQGPIFAGGVEEMSQWQKFALGAGLLTGSILALYLCYTAPPHVSRFKKTARSFYFILFACAGAGYLYDSLKGR